MEKLVNITLILVLILCLATIFLLLCMDSLEPLQYGIAYNKFTKYVDKEVYESGRYIIGPTKKFVVYPANMITIEFSTSKTANVSLFNHLGTSIKIKNNRRS